MYRIPNDLDISKATGQCTTQFCVGPSDLQFSIGDVHFAIQSEIKRTRNGKQISFWRAGEWPEANFYNLLNVDVASHTIPNDREIVIHFNDGHSMHLYDNSDHYESMQIYLKGANISWII